MLQKKLVKEDDLTLEWYLHMGRIAESSREKVKSLGSTAASEIHEVKQLIKKLFTVAYLV